VLIGVEGRDTGRRAGVMAVDQDGAFRGRHVTAEVILWALRWYLAFRSASAISP
jgi:hypothetical protein